MTSSPPPLTSPDARLRVRTLLAPLPVGIVLLTGLAATGVQTGSDAFKAALGYLLYALLAVGVWRACRRAGMPTRALVGAPPSNPQTWALVALAVPLLLIETAVMPAVLSALAWIAPEQLSRILEEADDFAGNHTIVMAVLLAPIVEELVFRGVLLRALAARWGLWRGVIVSALAFGLLHLDSLGAVAFGVVMSLLYMRTGTLLVPIACHAVYNGIIVVAEPWMQDDGAPLNMAELRDAWWIGLLGIVGAVAIFIAVERRLRPEGGWRLHVIDDGAPTRA